MSAAFRDESCQINITNGLLLYYHRYSYYSQMVLMALYEKKLPFNTCTVDIVKADQYESWFLKLNPRGEIPVLQDFGKIIPDSVRIIDYLEDNFSNGDVPRLIPLDQGIKVKEKVIHFKSIIEHVPARILTIGSFYHSELVQWPKLPFIAPVRRLLANNEKNIGIKLRQCAEKNPGAQRTLLEKARLHDLLHIVITTKSEYLKVLKEVDDVLDQVEAELASSKHDQWLCCDRFTIADIALTVLLVRLNELGFEYRFWKNNKRPFLEQYYVKVKYRDSYKRIIPSNAFHVKMFITTYKKPLIIGLSISVLAAVAIIVKLLT